MTMKHARRALRREAVNEVMRPERSHKRRRKYSRKVATRRVDARRRRQRIAKLSRRRNRP